MADILKLSAAAALSFLATVLSWSFLPPTEDTDLVSGLLSFLAFFYVPALLAGYVGTRHACAVAYCFSAGGLVVAHSLLISSDGLVGMSLSDQHGFGVLFKSLVPIGFLFGMWTDLRAAQIQTEGRPGDGDRGIGSLEGEFLAGAKRGFMGTPIGQVLSHILSPAKLKAGVMTWLSEPPVNSRTDPADGA